jgi:hypothetical protein
MGLHHSLITVAPRGDHGVVSTGKLDCTVPSQAGSASATSSTDPIESTDCTAPSQAGGGSGTASMGPIVIGSLAVLQAAGSSWPFFTATCTNVDR